MKEKFCKDCKACVEQFGLFSHSTLFCNDKLVLDILKEKEMIDCNTARKNCRGIYFVEKGNSL